MLISNCIQKSNFRKSWWKIWFWKHFN